MTLKAPPLAEVFARQDTLAFSSFARPNRLLFTAPESRNYLRRLDTAQRALQARIETKIPRARVRWRFGVVLNGFAVVVPHSELARLSRVTSAQVWPSIGYHTLLDKTPQIIGAPTVWGPTLATAGQGVKIAIVDDGIDQTHPFFAPAGYAYPAGFPKGQTAYTTPKVIVARAFAPATPVYANAKLPFDPDLSDHGIHVAGIAAGNNNTPTRTGGFRLSGIAPARLPRQLQGARHPQRVRCERELTRARRGHRGRRARRHGRHQPVARGDGDRPKSRCGCKGAERGRGCWRRLDGLSRQ